jgi:uncharacterized membrane protein YraQ (UPF0718 family)
MLLLCLGMPFVGIMLVVLAQGGDPRDVGMYVGDEPYAVGEFWWLVTPLGILSVVAVFRLGFGYRDWLAPILSAIWLGIAAAFAIKTAQYSFVTTTAVVTLLLTSGIWRARQEAEEDGVGLGPDD